MQPSIENAQRLRDADANQSGSIQINQQIENALSLLANNPAVSAEVVRTIRDIYTSHTQSGTSNGVQNSQSSPLSEEEQQPEQVAQRPEVKHDAESAGEQSSEEDSSHANTAGSGGGDAAGKRLHLTEEQVIEIYNLRPQYGRQGRLRRGSMLRCKTIAPRYGVTPKTIRDIWCGRTWPQTTEHLWTEEERAARQSLRKPDALRGHDVKQALEDLRVSFLGASSAPPSSQSVAAVAAIPSPPVAEEVSWAAAAGKCPENPNVWAFSLLPSEGDGEQVKAGVVQSSGIVSLSSVPFGQYQVKLVAEMKGHPASVSAIFNADDKTCRRICLLNPQIFFILSCCFIRSRK